MRRADSAAALVIGCPKVTKIVTVDLLNAQFLDAITKLAKSQPEKFGGSRLVVARFLQRIDDCLALYIFDLISEIACGSGRPFSLRCPVGSEREVRPGYCAGGA